MTRSAIVLLVLLASCATISTRAGKGPVPRGVRVYPPQVFLLVDEGFERGKGRSTLLVVPNLGEPYDVKPVTVLARNDFRIEVEDGMLRSLSSAQDTTALLALLKGGAELGARAVGVGVSARDFEGTYGLPSGIYRLEPNGTFAAVRRPGE